MHEASWASNLNVGRVVVQDKTKTDHAIIIIINSGSWKRRDNYLHAAQNSLLQLLDWKGLAPTSLKECLQRHIMLKKIENYFEKQKKYWGCLELALMSPRDSS